MRITDIKSPISACLIVKNEEKRITACLQSIRSLVAEIVVVDTGSTDQTIPICREFNCKIYEHEWQDDFSLHRNQSIDYATHDWILIIDADEVLPSEYHEHIRKCLYDDDADIVWFTTLNFYPDSKTPLTHASNPRLFRKSTGAKYEGIVHNLLKYPKDVRKAKIPVRLHHFGYADEDLTRKHEQRHRLLMKQIEADGDNSRALLQIAELNSAKNGFFNREKAPFIFHACERAAALTDPRQQKGYFVHVQALNLAGWAALEMDDLQKADNCAVRALKFKSNYLDAIILMAYIKERQDDLNGALFWFDNYLKAQANYNPDTDSDPVQMAHLDDRAVCYLQVGRIYVNQKKMDAAVNFLFQAAQFERTKKGALELLNLLKEGGHLRAGEITRLTELSQTSEDQDATRTVSA